MSDKFYDAEVSGSKSVEHEKRLSSKFNVSFGAEASEWSNVVDNMCEYSKSYPEDVFMVRSETCEIQEIGCYYFKNGKFVWVGAIITYPEFDEGALECQD